ncbi:RidA family protein [Chitinibacteraceae bacterium HSL-7]
MTIERINTTPRWSDATIYNNLIHFVEVPNDASVPFAAQVAQVLQQAEATLALAGSDKSRLLMATIYLPDRSVVAEFNAQWDAWLPAGAAPSRACLQAGLMNPDMLVEIVFVAARA